MQIALQKYTRRQNTTRGVYFKKKFPLLIGSKFLPVYSDGGQVQDLLDQVRQRAQAAEDALEAAEERAEKYRSVIDENNRELNEFREKVRPLQNQSDGFF